MKNKNTPEEISNTLQELHKQILDKEKLSADLLKANQSIHFQNEEKEHRSKELDNAKDDLNNEKILKENSARALALSNKKLLYEIEQKEKHAAELAAANQELIIQNIEIEKLAEELVEINLQLLQQSKLKDQQALELEAVNKELESFSYSISHDLRAPLRAISGFTQVLVEDYANQMDDDANFILQEVISNAEKMGELIDNLLEFSRIGKQHIARTLVNMNELISDVLTEQKRLEPARNISLDVKNIEHIPGDRNMLRQVFVNLISNAFKYTSKKDQAIIEIGSHKENTGVTVYVKDNGAGFDMRYYDKLFGVFQRLHSNCEFDGTGVGLAIVQKIINKHMGKVWAESKVDEGTCFYVWLPAQ